MPINTAVTLFKLDMSKNDIDAFKKIINIFLRKIFNKLCENLIANVKQDEAYIFLNDFVNVAADFKAMVSERINDYETSKVSVKVVNGTESAYLYYVNNTFIGWLLSLEVTINDMECCYRSFLHMLMNKLWKVFSKETEKFLFFHKSDVVHSIINDESYIAELAQDIYGQAVFGFNEFIFNEINVEIKTINNIAASSYEHRINANARVLFLRDMDKAKGLQLMFEKCTNISSDECEFIFEKIRLTRKLLEISGSSMPLIVELTDDGSFLVGFKCDYDKPGQDDSLRKDKCILWDCYNLKITGHSDWELFYGDKKICKYSKGIYMAFCCEILAYLRKHDINTELSKIIDEAFRKSKHGALFIIIGNKEKRDNEIRRLLSKNMLIKFEKPYSLKDHLDMIERFTSIDGSIILDDEGLCYGVGCIIDGKTNKNCKYQLSRGSRYNSAKNYVESMEGFAKAIVLSEDGGIDIITSMSAGKAICAQKNIPTEYTALELVASSKI